MDDDVEEAAMREVANCIPTELTGATMIRLSDVENLMVLAFRRGATWQREALGWSGFVKSRECSRSVEPPAEIDALVREVRREILAQPKPGAGETPA